MFGFTVFTLVGLPNVQHWCCGFQFNLQIMNLCVIIIIYKEKSFIKLIQTNISVFDSHLFFGSYVEVRLPLLMFSLSTFPSMFPSFICVQHTCAVSSCWAKLTLSPLNLKTSSESFQCNSHVAQLFGYSLGFLLHKCSWGKYIIHTSHKMSLSQVRHIEYRVKIVMNKGKWSEKMNTVFTFTCAMACFDNPVNSKMFLFSFPDLEWVAKPVTHSYADH